MNLTAVWHGLYSYPRYFEPVYFVATLVSFGSCFSGQIHEATEGRNGAPLTLFASVEGTLVGRAVNFCKVYDGTGNWNHSVNYEGTVSADDSEIEGTWSIAGVWSGTFLMIRGNKASESVIRKAYAHS